MAKKEINTSSAFYITLKDQILEYGQQIVIGKVFKG